MKVKILNPIGSKRAKASKDSDELVKGAVLRGFVSLAKRRGASVFMMCDKC